MSTARVGRSRSSTGRQGPSVSPESLRGMPTEVLRLHLANHRLVTTGRRDTLIRRLRGHLHTPDKGSRTPGRRGTGSKGPAPTRADPELHAPPAGSDSPTSSGEEDGDEQDGDGSPSSGDDEDGSPDTDADGARSSATSEQEEQPDSSPEPTRPRSRAYRSAATLRSSRHREPAPAPAPARRRHHRHHRHSRRAPGHSSRAAHRRGRTRYRSPSPSGSSSSSSSSADSRDYRRSRKRRRSSSSTSISPSSPSASPYRHRSSGRHHHRHRHRHRDWSHSDSDEWAPPSAISCAPPLPRRLVERIRRGKYVSFDKLLLPTDSPPLTKLGPTKARAHRSRDKRMVSDFASWSEAWNRYLCARLSSHQDLALELAKYQTMVAMLFTSYPVAACVQYDKLFRQAAGQDPSLRWDALKEDIYVWCFTRQTSPPSSHGQQDRRPGGQQSFRDRQPIATRLGPPPERATLTATGREICRRYNYGKCPRGDECPYAHACWTPGCHGPHPGNGCSKRST